MNVVFRYSKEIRYVVLNAKSIEAALRKTRIKIPVSYDVYLCPDEAVRIAQAYSSPSVKNSCKILYCK